jgi:hypothetical protein
MQPTMRKLFISNDKKSIFGLSGPVSLAQRFSYILEKRAFHDPVQHVNEQPKPKNAPELMAAIQRAFREPLKDDFKMAQAAAPFIGSTAAAEGVISHSIVATVVGDNPCLLGFDQQCNCEEYSLELPFVTIGSCPHIADSFLAFLRRAFWDWEHPNVREGVLAAAWTIYQAIATNPGGVAGPIDIATLEKADGKNWSARMFTDQETQETYDFIESAEGNIKEFKEGFLHPPEEDKQIPEKD